MTSQAWALDALLDEFCIRFASRRSTFLAKIQEQIATYFLQDCGNIFTEGVNTFAAPQNETEK